MEKKCPICGKEFIAHRSSKIYCSLDCQAVAMNQRSRERRHAAKEGQVCVMRVCVICGAEFKPKSKQQLTCSTECSEARISQRRKEQYAQRERRKCEMCGAEFIPSRGGQLMCAKCIREERQKKELVTKAVEQAENKPVKKPEDWEREARECGIDYGTYRGLVTVFGKTKEEIKALHGGSETAHAHAGKSTRRAGVAMGVKMA